MTLSTTLNLSLRYAQYRWRHVLLVVILGAALSGSVVGVAELRASGMSAIESSIKADQAGRSFAIQTGLPADSAKLSTVPGLLGVAYSHGTARFSGRLVPITIRTVSEARAPLGIVVSGARPRSASEATLSRAVTRSLGLSVGDTFDVTAANSDSINVRLVGITVSPATVDDASAVIVDPEANPETFAVWLSERNPYDVRAIRPILDSRTTTFQSVENLLLQSSTSLPQGLAELKYVPLAVGFLIMVLLGGMFASLASVARVDVDSLIVAGLAPYRSWRVVLRVAVGALASGLIFGIVFINLLFGQFITPLSGLFGQYWVELSLPWATIFGLFACVLAAALCVKPALGIRAYLLAHINRSQSKRPSNVVGSLMLASVGACLLSIAFVSHNQTRAGDGSRLAPVGALLIAAGIPGLVQPLTLLGLPVATKKLHRRLSGGLALSVVAICVISVGVATHTAQSNHDVGVIQSVARLPQPAGSLLIAEMPARAADELAREYARVGGKSLVQYGLLDETSGNLRVTSTELVDCMQENNSASPDSVPESCFPQNTYSPVNTVLLDLRLGAKPTADPGLVTDGAVGLLLFQGKEGRVTSLSKLAASANSQLGGNMPGLVVSPTSSVAERFNLRPSGSRFVALLDFSSLAQAERAEIRGLVARLASASQTIDASGSSAYQSRVARANAVGLAGAGLVLLTLIVSGWAVVVANRTTLRTLVDLGASKRARGRMAFRWMLGPMVCLALSFPLVVATVSISGLKQDASIGWFWISPLVAGLLGCLILISKFMVVPDRVGE